MVLIGIMGGFGQIFLTESYRHAPASVIAPFDYTGMIFALLWGYFLFGDIPDTMVLIGAAIVSAAGILVILRERDGRNDDYGACRGIGFAPPEGPQLKQ